MQNKMKHVKFYKVPEENVEHKLLPFIENILVAHHRQIKLSKVDLVNIYKEIGVISRQNKLNVSFICERSETHERISVQYDVLDLMYAMTILERSVTQN